MLRAKGISKEYVTKKRNGLIKRSQKIHLAVKNISINVEKGKIIGLLGVNGAGKTTTIKMLTTLLEPDSGVIELDGENIANSLVETRKKINTIVGGERNLYWRLSPIENLKYFGALYGIRSEELKNRIKDLLELVGLSDSSNVPVEQFSKGMKQRLQIAKGLINNPEYIFLDEPTLGLDLKIAVEMRKYIKLLANEKNKGILLTTHYIHEAEELCDYIYILNDGEVILEGTKEVIMYKMGMKKKYIFHLSKNDALIISKGELAEIFIVENNILKENIISISTTDDFGEFYEIVKLLLDNNINLQGSEIIIPKLEDVLLEIMKGSR
ncbi:ABC transporter ATP-binding protein [Listeria welshimeri]|uniref:ABC transporter ATP-binding protein n=1 Tax=Listeria welshimeri TaxID=1643 RepID=A0A7X0W6J6_LISWE|nr:ABC transporter ATP-binding protein [Listeria welshimeri]